MFKQLNLKLMTSMLALTGFSLNLAEATDRINNSPESQITAPIYYCNSDLLLNIFRYLDVRNLGIALRVCKSWNAVLSDPFSNSIWLSRGIESLRVKQNVGSDDNPVIVYGWMIPRDKAGFTFERAFYCQYSPTFKAHTEVIQNGPSTFYRVNWKQVVANFFQIRDHELLVAGKALVTSRYAVEQHDGEKLLVSVEFLNRTAPVLGYIYDCLNQQVDNVSVNIRRGNAPGLDFSPAKALIERLETLGSMEAIKEKISGFKNGVNGFDKDDRAFRALVQKHHLEEEYLNQD